MRIWSALGLLLCSSVAFAQYAEAPVANGGSISGKITYDGTPPKPATITITQDPGTCGTTRLEDSWSIAGDGAVENVVVYLVDAKSGKKMDFPAQPSVDQKGCHYEPHVQIVGKGAEL